MSDANLLRWILVAIFLTVGITGIAAIIGRILWEMRIR